MLKKKNHHTVIKVEFSFVDRKTENKWDSLMIGQAIDQHTGICRSGGTFFLEPYSLP